MSVDAKKFRQLRITSAAQPERFQSYVESTLLLIEQAVEKYDGSLEFVRRNLEPGKIGQDGN